MPRKKMYPRYLKLEHSNFYVKIIDADNNMHFRFNEKQDQFCIDFNGSPNESYDDMKGVSRSEFDKAFKKVVFRLNQTSNL